MDTTSLTLTPFPVPPPLPPPSPPPRTLSSPSPNLLHHHHHHHYRHHHYYLPHLTPLDNVPQGTWDNGRREGDVGPIGGGGGGGGGGGRPPLPPPPPPPISQTRRYYSHVSLHLKVLLVQ
ncbi:hypothetical protein E2C01_071120 [Portunus trituberculatus]|uniref:Uncharacterized protein n=1 Tax=Portunus trituberculatus TaxID=210409 RepID=A0A5B7I401_PORTR|nr:hypothetical protein [Portunus trituberculatus]